MFRLVLSLALLLFAPPVLAASRLALVIGNDSYDEVPDLRKAVNDAVAVSRALESQGFEVILLRNATRREMNRGLSDFTGRLAPGDTALIFFAGHGVEIDGENYLLPTDIVTPASGDPAFVIAEAMGLSQLLDRIRATGARTTLGFIDACRENPFAGRATRGIGTARGLGRLAAPEGTFVVFSAGAGQLALDRLSEADEDPNSVFTRALLPRLARPGLELRDMVKEVRLDVRDLALGVDHAQFPAYYDELLGEFYFSAPEDGPAPAPAPTGQDDRLRADFELARSLGTRTALTAFLDRHGASGDSFELDIAREMLAALTPDAPTPQPEPAAPATDIRGLVRAVQENLNRLGCDAGGADGIAGGRTRAAFARFLDAAKPRGLGPGDLASQAALDALVARSGRVCPAPVAAPAPSGAPAPETPTIAGTWNYSASCPFFIKVQGSLRLSAAGADRYSGTIADNLGQRGRITVTVLGRTLQGRNDWSTGVVETWTGTLASDGRSYRAKSSTGCTSDARRG